MIDEFKADPGISFLQAGRFMELDKGRLVAYIQDLNDKGVGVAENLRAATGRGGSPRQWW